MRLKEIVLRNFRGYKGEVRIPVNPDLTAFIGRNDVGKSSILDALAIFFDSPLVKFEPADLCVHAEVKEVRIGCVFDDLPDTLTLDATSTTNLNEEYLLNKDGDLEIHKVFDCSLRSPKPRVVACARHPTADGFADLLQIKHSELKQRLQNKSIDTTNVDQRSNPSIRKALWGACDNLQLSQVDIELNKEDAKKVWDQIQKYMPIFALFRADRPSTDEDSEVQDPMKLAIRQAVSELTNELRQVKDKIRDAAMDVARRTLEKLKDLDPALAKELNPTFRSDPKWDSLFKLALTTEDQIPVNKRGSGVRRLILLGFFRAEAERRRAEENRSNIIYAIEEPETSQHPSNQRAVIEALKDLASADGCQVVITTHVPGLAEMIPTDALRYVRMEDDGTRVVERGTDKVLQRIADDLGVIPDNRVRVFVCVEGPNDVAFLRNMAKVLWDAGCDVGFDPDNTPEIVFLPLGGSTLRDWVNSHYLKPLRRPEVHIYDRGTDSPPKYQQQVNEVNGRGDGSGAMGPRDS
jgi:predicted ATP-dependent endonuclease of OLD family